MVSKSIEDFLAFLREIEQSYYAADTEESEANAETQDLLHCIELEEHTYNEFAKLSKGLREIRKKRRKAKETMAQCSPVLGWIDQNRGVVKGLEALLGQVRKAERVSEGPNLVYVFFLLVEDIQRLDFMVAVQNHFLNIQ